MEKINSLHKFTHDTYLNHYKNNQLIIVARTSLIARVSENRALPFYLGKPTRAEHARLF